MSGRQRPINAFVMRLFLHFLLLFLLLLLLSTERTTGTTVFFSESVSSAKERAADQETTPLPLQTSGSVGEDDVTTFTETYTGVSHSLEVLQTTVAVPATTTSKEPARGLRCSDRSDPTFAMPPYCVLNVGKLQVTRDAEGKGFGFVYPEAFDGLDVKELNLGGLSIRNLDSASFRGLQSLNALHLDNNNIRFLPQDVFYDLTDLTHLYLDSNRLVELKTGLLDNQRRLIELSLANNAISVIEDNVFRNHIYLEKLHLNGNLLNDSTFSNATFTGPEALSLLNLGSNSIRTLSAEMFKPHTFLQNLNLTRNLIRFVPNGVFPTSSLNTIDLSFNEIEDLGDKAFEGMRLLAGIYLNDNRLTGIRKETFGGLDGMKTISFENNRITSLKSNSLSGLTQLVNLNLRNNSIQGLPLGWSDAVGNLEFLDLSHNAIKNVEEYPFKTPIKLAKIDLSYNKLQVVDGKWFDTNGDLVELNLRSNQLTSLPEGIFNVPVKLSKLDLGMNRFKQDALRFKFQNLTYLKVLYLDNNSMTTFDADEARCQGSLEELYLNVSCLESVRVVGFTLLKRLDLHRNYIQFIGTNDISGLTSLETFDASDNNITFFDFKSLANSTNLIYLNLSTNLLTDVDSVSILPTGSSRVTFDFSWNSITDLSKIPELHKFYLASEQFQCSCNHFPKWKSLESFGSYQQTVCTDGNNNLHFLACFLTNPSFCQVKPVLNSATLSDWCSKAVPSNSLKTRPIVYKESCKFPRPQIFQFDLNYTNDGFIVTWNASNINSLKWFSITWTQSSENGTANSTGTAYVQRNSEFQFFGKLQNSGMTTVCITTEPVYIFIPKSEKCGSVNFTARLISYTPPILPPNDPIPFWAWIILAFGILLLLLLLIILIIFCIIRSRNKKLEKERLEEERRRNEIHRKPSFNSSFPEHYPDLPPDTAEQSVVSIDMYAS